jgi:hypothetical protein
MLSLVALVLSSNPVPLTCEQLWPEVWARFVTVETAATPFFGRFPNGQALLGQMWISECEAFDAGTLACARRERLERELAELRAKLEREKVPPAERNALISRLRSEWSILDCKEVNRALDRAAERAARQLADAGVPERDDCAGDDLVSGRCRCAHRRCLDQCCRAGEACAHGGSGPPKCVRAR